MDELVRQVASKAGMSEEMARQAVETVIGYLKDKLPGPVGSQIDGLLGGASKANDLGGMAKKLGGLLGRK